MGKKKKPSDVNGSASVPKKTLKKPKPDAVARQVKIRRHVSPDEKAVYANHVVVRCDPAMYQLFFFDAQPPIAEEGDPSNAPDPTYADAHCVSRVIIPHYVMPLLINALVTNANSLSQITKAFEAGQAAQQQSAKG